jgi:uncharacterized surface anchored protein
VTAADGTVCIDGLPFGDYYVTETSPPPGYKKDDSTTHTVTVDTNTTCSTTPYVGESISFTDTPLTDITAHAESQAAGGTKSRISCVGPSPSTTDVGNSPQPPDSGSPPAPQFADPVTVTANGLSPGTYTCTIVIDP